MKDTTDKQVVGVPNLVADILRESEKYDDEQVASLLETLCHPGPEDVAIADVPVRLLRILAHAFFLRNLAQASPDPNSRNARCNEVMADLADTIFMSEVYVQCRLWDMPDSRAPAVAQVQSDGKIAWIRTEPEKGGRKRSASRMRRLC